MNFWEGERVRLRAVEPGDAAFFFELQSDTERNRLLDFLHPPSSRAALETWAREQSRREPKDDAFQRLIESKTGERVGYIVTHTCNPRDGTLSYPLDIAAKARREGYTAEAISFALRQHYSLIADKRSLANKVFHRLFYYYKSYEETKIPYIVS